MGDMDLAALERVLAVPHSDPLAGHSFRPSR